MRACIRRGAHEIGGTCVELESQGQRIVLDVGLPLDAEPALDLIPPVPGLVSTDHSLLGVFISHAHRDHYGLLSYATGRPRVFMGADAARMLEAASLLWGGAAGIGETEPLCDRVPIDIGAFRVTPYLVDHSAYDAYAVLVEAGKERLFYSGDIRGHGRKWRLFERLLRDHPRDVDTLLLEGTMISRPDERTPTESELEEQFVELIRDTPGLVLVQASALNIDRLVTVFRATRKANRQFIIDAYAASVLRAAGNDHLPQAEWEGVRVYLPKSQKRAIIEAQAFSLSQSFRSSRIYPETLAEEAERSVMLFRPSMIRDLEEAGCLGGARLLYSLWPGYLGREDQRPFREWLQRQAIPLFYCHTSGHASVSDLKRLSRALAPASVVPIHTCEREEYGRLFGNVDLRGDGEWWEVGRKIRPHADAHGLGAIFPLSWLDPTTWRTT